MNVLISLGTALCFTYSFMAAWIAAEQRAEFFHQNHQNTCFDLVWKVQGFR